MSSSRDSKTSLTFSLTLPFFDRFDFQFANIRKKSHKKNKHMVFILAASSLDHALETLTREKRDQYKERIFSIPGLSLNPNTKNPEKIVQNFLSKDLKEKNNIVIWHGVLNYSISRHGSNNFQALTVPQLIDVLKALQNKLSALVFCQRHRTPNIFEDLNVLKTDHNIEVFSIVEDFISSKNKRIRNF